MLIVLWLCGTLAEAANGSVNAAQAVAPVEKAVSEAELAGKLRFYAGISELQVSFKQRKWMKDMDLELKSEGQLRLKRPSTVEWEISKPSRLMVRVGNSGIHLESGSGAKMTTQDFKMGELPSDRASKGLTGLVAWLNLDAHVLSEEYRVFTSGPLAFRFEPKIRDSIPFEALQMKLTTAGHLERLTILETSKDRIEIDFGNPSIVSAGR